MKRVEQEGPEDIKPPQNSFVLTDILRNHDVCNLYSNSGLQLEFIWLQLQKYFGAQWPNLCFRQLECLLFELLWCLLFWGVEWVWNAEAFLIRWEMPAVDLMEAVSAQNLVEIFTAPLNLWERLLQSLGAVISILSSETPKWLLMSAARAFPS